MSIDQRIEETQKRVKQAEAIFEASRITKRAADNAYEISDRALLDAKGDLMDLYEEKKKATA